MSKHDDDGEDEVLGAIDDLVRIQQRMAARWGRYAVESVDRLQSGCFDVAPWLDSYGKLAEELMDDVVASARAVGRLRGRP